MRSGVNDEQLSEAVKSLREENQLTYAEDDAAQHEPKIVCSMGLISGTARGFLKEIDTSVPRETDRPSNVVDS